MTSANRDNKTKKDIKKASKPNKTTVKAIIEGRKLIKDSNSKRYSTMEALREELNRP